MTFYLLLKKRKYRAGDYDFYKIYVLKFNFIVNV